MRLSNLLVGAFVVGSMFTACTTDEITIPKSELYAREFIKKFGVIDPSRDFSAAVHTGINVVTSAPTDVKVYADIDGKRYIFAEGRGIKGTTPIKFDIPKGVNEVIVDAGKFMYKTRLGGTVTVGSSKSGRAIWEKEDGVVKISRGDFRELTDEGIMAFKNYLPEDKDNLGKVTQNFNFVANGNFTVYPVYWCTNGYNTLGIYYIDEEKNEMVHIPFYTNKITPIDDTKGNLLYTKRSTEVLCPGTINAPLKNSANPYDAAKAIGKESLNPADYNTRGLTSFLDFEEEDWAVFKRRLKKQEREHWKYSSHFWDLEKYFELSEMNSWIGANWSTWETGARCVLGDFTCEAADATHVNITSVSMTDIDDWTYRGEEKDSHPGGDVVAWKSRGINVEIKPGTKFGMFIRVWHGNNTTVYPEDAKPSIDNVDIVRLPLDKDGKPVGDKYVRYYSEAKYNPVKNNSDVFGSTYMYEAPTGTYRVLGFEDWGDSEHDLNDMMFFIHSENPYEIPDVEDKDKPAEPYEWLIAAEDLGGYYDWDFNDAVFAVTAQTVVTGEGETALTNTDITVEPLAAGGTLPIYVMFNGAFTYQGQEFAKGHHHIGPELHRWLGAGSNVQINVRSAVQEATGEPITFTVEGEWSIADHFDNPKWLQGNDVKGMGGFYVLVNPKDDIRHHATPGVKTFDGVWDDKDSNHIVQSPTKFAPSTPVVSIEMLCLQNTWCWPQEEQSIHSVYGSFQDWLESKANTWYGSNHTINNIAKDRTVKRKARQ